MLVPTLDLSISQFYKLIFVNLSKLLKFSLLEKVKQQKLVRVSLQLL